MTPVLISRTMTRTRLDGVQTQCSINFGTPAINADLSAQCGSTMYYCPIQLTGFQNDYIHSLSGEDPLDALVGALCFASTLLGSSLQANELDWDASINYGFPIFPDFNPPPGGTPLTP